MWTCFWGGTSDLDEDATEGQIADYYAAEESEDWGDWGYGEIEYFCDGCQSFQGVIVENLNDLNALVKGWHLKAEEQEDYFSKYVFEYLSFIAHIKNNLFVGIVRDRDAIQALKRETRLKDQYIKSLAKDAELRTIWKELIVILRDEPIYNSSHDYDFPDIDLWWNSLENNPNRSDEEKKGVVHGLEDWGNMVEFWVAVRNNLFHGGKDPNIVRDQFLVKSSYLTMSPFMGLEVSKL